MAAESPCTIVVTPRDRFSTTAACLDSIFENTPEPFALKALFGGAPAHQIRPAVVHRMMRILKRQDIAFGEIHCQLVVAATASRLGIYDERFREGHEMDSGLTLSRHGRRMVLEPRSMVYLTYPEQLDDVDDVSIYVWKWDMPAMLDGWDYFKKKWNIDVNPDGRYEQYLRNVVNTRVGYWTRRWPSRLSIAADRMRRQLRSVLVGR